MAEAYWIPHGEAVTRLVVKNSRFIGRAVCTTSVAEAKAYIQATGAAEPGCTHVVYGYILGSGNSVTCGMSDAGEPPGTAGRPLLEVLKGSGLGDITLVVVRYFGGTKLGTGGLVKAYTETAQETLKLVKRVQKIKKICLEVTFPYELYNQFERILTESGGEILSRDFNTDVYCKLEVPENNYSFLENGLNAASGGKVRLSRAGAENSREEKR